MISFSEKIVWRYEIQGNETPRFFLGQEKTRQIKKGIEEMKNNWFFFNVSKMKEEDLNLFIPLYSSFIKQKHNSNPHNLKDRYLERLEQELESNQIFFASIKNNTILVGGGIFILKAKTEKKIASLGFRADDESLLFRKQKLWTYLEYLFYERALSNNIHSLSRGQDRNGAWWIGSGIGIALHKLESKFRPKVPTTENILQIDEKNIQEPTLFFLNPNDKGYFQEAKLIHSEKYKQAKDLKSALEKRGIQASFD